MTLRSHRRVTFALALLLMGGGAVAGPVTPGV
jgi:hypothetical protein